MKLWQMYLCSLACGVVAALCLSGCGGVGDTSDPDNRIHVVSISTMPDGSEVITETVGEVFTDWDNYDTALGESPDSDVYGVSRQAFSYGANSRYGYYSAGTLSDGRCPNSWSSPNYCVVAGTKDYTVQDYFLVEPPNDDGITDAVAGFELTQALGYMSKGGFTLQSTQQESIANAWVDRNNGLCQQGAIACTNFGWGSVFTSGGKRFAKTVRRTHFGWPDVQAYWATNVETNAFNAHNIATCGTATFRKNNVQNTLEHEIAHGLCVPHNPSGGTTREVLPSPDRCYDPGTVLTSAEISGMAAYAP